MCTVPLWMARTTICWRMCPCKYLFRPVFNQVNKEWRCHCCGSSRKTNFHPDLVIISLGGIGMCLCLRYLVKKETGWCCMSQCVKQILTAGPLGPRSPFSHAHRLCARGHFKAQWGQRLLEGGHSGTQIKSWVLGTYSFICQCCLQGEKKDFNIGANTPRLLRRAKGQSMQTILSRLSLVPR